MGEWLSRDFWLIGLGIVATFWNLIHRHPKTRLIGLLSFLLILSIARGGPVYPFYIPPILPLLALNLCLAIDHLTDWISKPALLAIVLVFVAILCGLNLNRQGFMFTIYATKIQRQAIAWVQEHVPPDATILIDDDLWVDLHDGRSNLPNFRSL